MAELRQAIDAVRRLAGLPPAWTSYANATGPVLASQMTEMRNALDEGRLYLGFGTVGYTHTMLTPGQTVINHLDLDELRQGVK